MNLFPYDRVREIQSQVIEDIQKTIDERKNCLIHAPTGLGKTVSALVPALHTAIKSKLKIFFLTNRHTQHAIAVETIKAINEKHNVDIRCADVAGRQAMCLMQSSKRIGSREFTDYCKNLREQNSCPFYNNTYQESTFTITATQAADSMINPTITQIKETCAEMELCPYEIATKLAKKANVIIADYYHLFHPQISKRFLRKVNGKLKDSIIIVDEAHNLPDRIRNLLSTKLTYFMLSKAGRECTKYELFEQSEILSGIAQIIKGWCKGEGERLISKEMFHEALSRIMEYDMILDKLAHAEEFIKKKQERTACSGIIDFLENWLGSDEGYVRTLKMSEKYVLSYSCLDPGTISHEVFEECYSCILMSGTLNPLSMFRDVLNVPRAQLLSFTSPFPPENTLRLIVPKTTTKYTARSPAMYENIGKLCTNAIKDVKTAIFFPSYKLRDNVIPFIRTDHTIFAEQPTFSRDDKENMLKDFKDADKGVLIGVTAANFAEGVDLPGSLLECVIIVGLPLERPDLRTKALISYYDSLFNKGWDYGYLFPAMNKAFQAAGRCIRTEKDKGAIIFIDERYVWSNYLRCFPADWKIKISNDMKELNYFF